MDSAVVRTAASRSIVALDRVAGLAGVASAAVAIAAVASAGAGTDRSHRS